MYFLRSLAVVTASIVALLTPARAGADPLLQFLVGGPEVSAEFGLVPFQVDDRIRNDFGNSFDQLFHLSSGPLLDLDVDAVNGFTTYSYGPGTLTFSLTLEDADLNLVSGTFTAVTLPFHFTVCEGCDTLFGDSNADDFEIEFGSGVFDAAFAHAMGFPRTGHSGVIDFGLEDIDGGPASNVRTGFDHRGAFPLRLDVAEVPEPSLLVALSLGAAAIFGRRGIARARTSGRR
jgi:hypothetical protein